MHTYKFVFFIFAICAILQHSNAITVRYVTDLTVDTSSSDADVKAEVLNWIQSLHSIQYFSSFYGLSNITIYELSS